MAEKWKPVRNFPGYFVSDQGNVYSEKVKRLMKPHKRDSPGGKTGRPKLTAVCLTHNRKKHTMYVHRLVADTFICELTPADEVMHYNGDDTDNRLENLYIKGLEFRNRQLKKSPSPQRVDLGAAVLRHHLNQPKKEEKKWKSSTRGSLMTWITWEATSGS